jgi:ATP-dependent helicase/nuclease subunit A
MSKTAARKPKPTGAAKKFSHVVIRASAGSGKTFQLSNRYIALLHRGVPPEKILAVTFTRKAAGEIFDRIVLRLAEAARDDERRRELAENIGVDQLTAEECRSLVMSVVGALHRLRIGTLDSFFAKIAGSCSLEIGLPVGWRIVEEIVDSRLRDRAIVASLAGEGTSRVLALLSLLAKGEAIRSVSKLIRDTVQDLYSIARETDEAVWNRLPRVKGLAADELAAAVEQLKRISFSDKRFQTAVDKDLVALERENWAELVCKGLASKIIAGEEEYYKRPITTEVQAVYAPLIKHARAELVGMIARQTEATYQLLKHFGEHYRRFKLAHSALRFDDITHTLAQAQVADDRRVTFRLDAAIDHLLLDEFQDTSLSQWQVIKPIAQRVAGEGDGTSFFCVGDVKQAIYGWRGGLAELFDAVKEQLPGVEELPLDTSYRSSQAVIDVVNRVFSRLDSHPNLEKYEAAVKKWQQRFNTHSTARAELSGHVTLEACSAGKEGDDAAEAFEEFVANRIAEAYQRHPDMTIGVLTRTNASVLEIIYRLRGKGIPASEEGGNPLTDSCAVELLLSLVRLADHPGDTAAAYHIARSPLGKGFGLTSQEYRRTALVSEKLRRELIDEGYGRAIQRWADLAAAACDDRDRSRLQQLVELAYAYQADSTLRPSDFLDFVEQQRVSDPTTSAVRVMTVHQAKGLEFDIVFLPELDARMLGQSPSIVSSRDGIGGLIDCVCRHTSEDVRALLPAPTQKMFESSTEGQIGESLCVLYVALTRAIHGLHMLLAPIRENEKNFPKTFAGLLRAALCHDNDAKSGVLYSHGQADWYKREQERRASTAPTRETSDLGAPLKIVLAPSQVDRRRGLDRESPSRLEGGSAGRIRWALELSDPKRDKAMLRGTVMHAWFEEIVWLNRSLPSDEQLMARLSVIRGVETLSEPEKKAWLRDFKQMLREGETAQVLTEATYKATLPQRWAKLLTGEIVCQAKNEWPFAVIDDGRLLQGRMDRMVFLLRGGEPIAADVIDYKTDAITTSRGETLGDRVEHYRPQVEAYRRTVSQVTCLPMDRVTAGLLFVGPGTLWRPEKQA